MLFRYSLNAPKRSRLGAQDMHLVELLFGSHVNQNRLGARFDVVNQLIDADKLRRDIGGQSLLGKLGILRRIGIGRRARPMRIKLSARTATATI